VLDDAEILETRFTIYAPIVHWGNLLYIDARQLEGKLGSSPKTSCDTGTILGSRICKPNFVRGIALAGRPFLWAAHRCAALATYPEV